MVLNNSNLTVIKNLKVYLVLDDIEVGHHPPKDAVLHQVLNKEILFHLKDPRHQFWAILGSFARLQLIRDLLPVWVAGEGDK